MNDNIIEITGLNKVYGDFSAVKDLSLQIKRGDFFALLGANGAGKSTTISCLTNTIRKTSGKIIVNGFDLDNEIRGVKRSLGIVPQEIVLNPFLNVRNTVKLQAGLHGFEVTDNDVDELLDRLGLLDKRDTYIRKLSGGMKRRVLIAKALIHKPPVVVLDEPTAGVDIHLRNSLWEYVQELNDAGATIILTTHYLEEVEALCNNTAIMSHGEIVKLGHTKSLISSIDSKILTIVPKNEVNELPQSLLDLGFKLKSGILEYTYKPSEIEINDILVLIQQSSIDIADIKIQEPRLEKLFLDLY